MGKRSGIFFSVLGVLSVYLWFFRIPFPGVDDMFFKEPGYRMSQGWSFAAPGVQGQLRHAGIENVFAVYPPVYPFSFGLWFLVFGFSLGGSLLFSLLLCGAIAFLIVHRFEEQQASPLPWTAYGLAFAAWVSALSAIHRPDPLFLLLGLLCLRVAEPKRLLLLTASAIATSPGMGLFLLPYFGLQRRSLLSFLLLSLVALPLALAAWALVFRADPGLFRHQFLDRVLVFRVEDSVRGWNDFSGFYFFLPLFCILVLGALRAGRDPFLLPFLFLMGVWFFFLLVKTKLTYVAMTHLFMLYTAGRWVFSNPRWRGAVWFAVLAAVLPWVRMASMPLTWNSQDSYEYNGKRILEQIPEKSVIVTDVRFWYLVAPHHRAYEAHYAFPRRLPESDYVLLGSGGSGKPDAAWVPPSAAATRQYFEQNFKRKDSTLLNVPNRLFGFPIARSRWSYRFDLYERRIHRRANADHHGGSV